MTTSDLQQSVPRQAMAPPNAVPPQQPGELGRPPPGPTWPTVIGVISIVLGSGACLGGVWGVFAPQVMKLMAEMVPQSQAAPFSTMQEWSSWIIISSVVTMVIALILLAAGIDLVRRRARGVKLGRVWAVLKMIFGLVGAYMGFLIQQDQFRRMSQQNLPVGGAFVAAMGAVSVILGILWNSAYPVFLLIWFSRATIKAEYARWR